MINMLSDILQWIVIALLSAILMMTGLFLWEMNKSYERVRGKSSVISSPFGDIEYLEGGSGPAVLVIHGSGGGYDQGELLVDAVLSDR